MKISLLTMALAVCTAGVANAQLNQNAELSAHTLQALQAGADPAALAANESSVVLNALKSFIRYVEVTRVYFSGQSVLIPQADPNDAVWFFNNPDHIWGERSELTATIVHDGFLNGPYGLDHLAVSVRGASMDGLLQQIGPSSTTPWRFTWGENIAAGVQAGSIGVPQLHAALSGRGPTFWPAGSPVCSNSSMPCLVFENFTVNLSGPGLVCSGNQVYPCANSVSLALSTAPFQIKVLADGWDTSTVVTQNGQIKANVSCRSSTGNDPRCGSQPGDVAVGDAFIANVVQSTGTGWTGRQLGALDVTVRVLVEQWNNPCRTCIPQ
jgi:hypothetical protein